MRRIFASIGSIGLALAFVWYLLLLNAATEPQASVRAPGAFPAVTTAAAAPAFGSLSLDKPTLVTFDYEADDFAGATPRERMDQALDWLLLAALTDAGLSGEEYARATFDLPAARRSYLQPIANFEHGATRSRSLSNGQVIALIPAVPPNMRAHHLAYVFDEQRKNLGETPTAIIALEYEVDLDDSSATIVRRAPIDGASLLSERYGYREAAITGVKDFEAFLATTNDVVFAARRDGKLVLGGRKLGPKQYNGLRMEDVAALWQSERGLMAKIRAFEEKWTAEQDAFNSKWRTVVATPENEARFEAAKAQFQRRVAEDERASKLTDHSGFSLDPLPDYPRFAKALDESLSKVFQVAVPSGLDVDKAEINRVVAALERSDPKPYFALQRRIRDQLGHGNPFGTFLEQIESENTFQAARYDGDLAGTGVGMTLFYTDLLAKLWALDYLGSASAGVVPGFRSLPKLITSPVYRRELVEQYSTRLWFGHKNAGFQLGLDRSSLYLGRNATRIYAATMDPFQPGKEAEPNAMSSAFLGWWDDHYEEVATFEPEYERLNQIVKWSTIMGWMNAEGRGDSLAFLRDVDVEGNHWFPTWAESNDRLRFSGWSAVGFHARGMKAAPHETMPVLRSDPYMLFGTQWRVSGGVSLPGQRVLAERPIIVDTVDRALRRAALDYAKVSGRHPSLVRTLGGGTHQISIEAGSVKMVSAPRPEAKLRTAEGDLATADVTRVIFTRGEGISIATAMGGKPAGDLHIRRTKNGLGVAWRNRELDAAQVVAQRASRAPDMTKALLSDKDVQALVRLPGKDHFALKLTDSELWIEVAPEQKESATIAPGWAARVSDPAYGRRIVQVAVKEPWDLLAAVAEQPAMLKSAGKVLASARKIDRAALERPQAPEIVERLRNGDHAKAAQAISGEPGRMSAELRQFLEQGLKAADGLLADGRFVRASQRLAELQEMYGPLPELTLRKGLADIGLGRMQRAAQTATPTRPLRDAGKFFEEVNNRIRSADGRTGEAMDRWAAFAEWSHLHAQGKVPRGRISIEPDRDAFKMAFHSEEPLKPMPAGEIDAALRAEDAIIYAERDIPGFNNIDWSQPLRKSLDQLATGDFTVHRLINTPIGDFQPDFIMSADLPARVHLANPQRKVRTTHGTYRPAPAQCDSPTAPPECSQPPPSPIYVVTKKRA